MWYFSHFSRKYPVMSLPLYSSHKMSKTIFPAYEVCSFNCVTNGPQYRVAVRSTWKLQWFHGGVIFYNRITKTLSLWIPKWLGSAIYQCLQGIPNKDYFSAFTDWISRLEKCVSVKGAYFEGLKYTKCKWGINNAPCRTPMTTLNERPQPLRDNWPTISAVSALIS